MLESVIGGTAYSGTLAPKLPLECLRKVPAPKSVVPPTFGSGTVVPAPKSVVPPTFGPGTLACSVAL